MKKIIYNDVCYSTITKCFRELGINPNTFYKIKRETNMSDVEVIDLILSGKHRKRVSVPDNELNKQEICDYFLNGASVMETIKKFKISIKRLQSILAENNIPSNYHIRPSYNEEEIIKVCKESKNLTEVARKLNVSTHIVKKVATKNGIDLVKINYENFIKGLKEKTESGNYSVSALAEEYGVSERTVREYIKKYNFKTNKEYRKELVLKLREEGTPIIHIASRLNMSTRTVNKILNSKS